MKGSKKKTTENKPTDLNKELKDAVAALKTQCKDVAFFDSQMDRILSLKGQVDVEPVRIAVWEKEVVREVKGDTYWIALTKTQAVYHTYGGYTIVADSRNASSLYQTIAGIVNWFEDADKCVDAVLPDWLAQREADEGRKLLPSEEAEVRKEAYEALDTDCNAKVHVLNAPCWCFTDLATTYDIAATVVHAMNDLTDKAFGEPLQEEDTEANADFEDAVRGAEHIGKIIEDKKNESKQD